VLADWMNVSVVANTAMAPPILSAQSLEKPISAPHECDAIEEIPPR
jgi:hypothetical protein